MEYKGYTGDINYSEVDEVYFGRVQNITDVVIYEADTKEELESSFQEAVDDYIEMKSRLLQNK